LFAVIDTYVIAQIIGLVGFGFYTAAPYFKSRMSILKMELIGCIVICLHWHVLGFPVMFWNNVIWVYMILASMLKDKHKGADTLISMAYILVLINTYFNWEGALIDYAVFCSTNLAITCRYFKDLLRFRSFAFSGGIFSVIGSCCTLSATAILFNVIFTLGHARGLSQLIDFQQFRRPAPILVTKEISRSSRS